MILSASLLGVKERFIILPGANNYNLSDLGDGVYQFQNASMINGFPSELASSAGILVRVNHSSFVIGTEGIDGIYVRFNDTSTEWKKRA